jgi:MFS transporter, PAT family, beta-lactamase induction signal transducer AmpG
LSRTRLAGIVAALYFSEGLPYGIVKELVPMVLRFRHVDLTSIGLLNVVGIAWTLKFLWSPLVDEFGTYRRWIGGAVVGIAIALIGMSVSAVPSTFFYTFVAMLALASATQDIAVDAFTIRATPTELLGPVNSVRVTAYRIALTSPGILALVAQRFGWDMAFRVAAVVALGIFVVVKFIPSEVEDRRPRLSGQAGRLSSNFIAAMKHWLLRPKAGLLLAVAFTFRLCEFAVVSMIKPYWVDRGYTPAEIGTITSIVGVVVSIGSAILGGFIVARIGIYASLLWLGAAQCLSNIGYALVATFSAGRWAIYAAAVGENIGYGLGTAAFLAFLMSICDRDRAATEYALLSAAYGLTGTLMASASGYLAKHAGYPLYFWITVLLGIPPLLLIPLIRNETSNLHA